MSLARPLAGGSFLGEALLRPVGKLLGDIGAVGGGFTGIPGISIRWPWSPEAGDTSVLEAAPKKRTSHQKKRQRQLAGNNQVKPLRNLNRCPSCGHYKRAHTLCMNCVREIQKMWKTRDKQSQEADQDPERYYNDSELTDADKEFNYPKRLTRPTEYQRKLADTESYVLGRPRTLVVKEKQPRKRNLSLLHRRPYEK